MRMSASDDSSSTGIILIVFRTYAFLRFSHTTKKISKRREMLQMPTNYLYGTVLTSGEQVAANNRGDTLGGNTTTLQKIFLGEDVHTTVSAEAIRFALRYRFQLQGLNVNRKYVYDKGKYE